MVHGGWRRRTAVAVVGLLALTATACGDDDDDDAGGTTTSTAEDGGGENVVSIEETEYAYVVTGTAREGWVTVDLDNTGDQYHMMAVGRMREGVTVDDVQRTLTGASGGDDEEGAPEDEGAAGTLGEIELISAQEDEEGEEEGEDPFALLFEDEELGAPGHFLAPGESMEITTELQPGEYALMCFVTTPDGASDHISEGMINSFTVEESDDPAPAPEADVQITIADGSVDMPDEIASGALVEIDMSGSEHEFGYARLLDEDATLEELDAYFDRFDEEPLPTRDTIEDGPGVLETFIFSAAGDQRFFISRDLDPGVYFIGCGLDESDGSETGEGRDHAETELKRVTVT